MIELSLWVEFQSYYQACFPYHVGHFLWPVALSNDIPTRYAKINFFLDKAKLFIQCIKLQLTSSQAW